MANSFTPHRAQTDLTVAPTWVWPNEDDEMQRHHASIDGEKNIYTVTSQGWVRKFTSDGQLLWSFRCEKSAGRILTDLNLHSGSIYFATTGNQGTGKPGDLGRMVGGRLMALGMQSGELLWQKALPEYESDPDSRTVFVADGVLLFSMRDREAVQGWPNGNNKVVASKASDGSHLWDYDIDGVVWNFMPSTPGDGSFLFATNDGRAHRLDLQTGNELWKASYPKVQGMTYSTGGGVLGPDGRFYVATNYYTSRENVTATPFEDLAPCRPPEAVDESTPDTFIQGAGQFAFRCLVEPDCYLTPRCPDGPGLYLVYRVSDGAILQRRRMPGMLNQYPAVGPVDDRLTVVLSVGPNPPLAVLFFIVAQTALPSFLRYDSIIAAIFKLQFNFAWVRRLLGFPIFKSNTVAALDAETGKQVWSYTEAPWDHFTSAGDEEHFTRRYVAMLQDDRVEPICGPDSWGIPVIAGDGTIYASSGLTGKLFTIRDRDGNGQIEPAEVSTFDAGQAFLNGPALAPGLLVASPCWGPFYVWKTEA